MYLLSLIIAFATAREVSSTSCTAFSFTPQFRSAVLISPTSALLEFIASLPPRSITVLPALKQRVAASTVTFGRDSKIIPIVPIGTRFLITCSPFGRSLPPITAPTGSGSDITLSTPSAMPPIRCSVRVRRSIIASDIPFALAVSISSLFAPIISVTCERSREDISERTRFFSFVPITDIAGSAALALAPSVSMYSIRYPFLSLPP